jgi:hypothetical protein
MNKTVTTLIMKPPGHTDRRGFIDDIADETDGTILSVATIFHSIRRQIVALTSHPTRCAPRRRCNAQRNYERMYDRNYIEEVVTE